MRWWTCWMANDKLSMNHWIHKSFIIVLSHCIWQTFASRWKLWNPEKLLGRTAPLTSLHTLCFSHFQSTLKWSITFFVLSNKLNLLRTQVQLLYVWSIGSSLSSSNNSIRPMRGGIIWQLILRCIFFFGLTGTNKHSQVKALLLKRVADTYVSDRKTN